MATDTVTTYNVQPTVAAGRCADYRSSEWQFVVSGRESYNGHAGRILMDRKAALRLRRDLNALLKATAPPRRRRG